MALHNITEEGNIQWRCHHDECPPLNAHISHDNLQWISQDLVALPPCACGSRCFVKVSFTDKELQAANMQQYGMVPTEMTVPHAVTGEMIPVMIPTLKAVGPNPFVERHQKLAELLKASGKHPPQPASAQEASDANTTKSE